MDGPAPSEGDSSTDGEKGEGSSASSSAETSEKQGEDSAGGDRSLTPTPGLTPNPSPKGEGSDYQRENEKQGESGQEGENGQQEASDYTSLWEEDAFMGQQITDIIHSTTQWGSLPLNMVELIQKAAEGKIDYRNALRAFRSSILSQKRHLTRMYPSRRFGFEQMGSRYEFTTRLLVAIDTSGSVGSEELGRYYRIITTFFKYGIQEIDVLMFDADVQGEPVTLKEAQKGKQTFEVKGRGGTSFQAPVNYVANHPDYDGLIIMTDGYAPVPNVPALLKTKLLWVIDNEPSYKQHYNALRKTGRVCLMQL